MAKRKRTPSVPLLLPHPADEFVGRRAELDELVRALQPGQTVGAWWASRASASRSVGRRRHRPTAGWRRAAAQFPRRRHRPPCEQYPEEHLLLSALARTLGGAAYPDPRATVATLLEGKRLLIVLENVDALSTRAICCERVPTVRYRNRSG